MLWNKEEVSINEGYCLSPMYLQWARHALEMRSEVLGAPRFDRAGAGRALSRYYHFPGEYTVCCIRRWVLTCSFAGTFRAVLGHAHGTNADGERPCDPRKGNWWRIFTWVRVSLGRGACVAGSSTSPLGHAHRASKRVNRKVECSYLCTGERLSIRRLPINNKRRHVTTKIRYLFRDPQVTLRACHGLHGPRIRL